MWGGLLLVATSTPVLNTGDTGSSHISSSADGGVIVAKKRLLAHGESTFAIHTFPTCRSIKAITAFRSNT